MNAPTVPTTATLSRLLRVFAWLSPAVAILVALMIGGLILTLSGHNALSAYHEMFVTAFWDTFGLSETLVRAVPLILCALAVALCLHASLWNIGAEGQMLMGCLTATWVALAWPGLSSWLLLSAMLVAGFFGGALWAAVAGWLRSRLAVNEILTTLLMNYVAIELIAYLVYGPWKDRAGGNFPNTPLFAENAWLPFLSWGRLHAGCLIAPAMAVIVYIVLHYTTFGFELRVVGDNPKAAVYAGIPTAQVILVTLILSGGLAGIAGFVEVAGIEHKLHHRMPKGYGYMAIIIAWLAKKHPLWIMPVAIFMAGITIGGEVLPISHNIPRALVQVLQGSLLLGLLLTDLLQAKLAIHLHS